MGRPESSTDHREALAQRAIDAFDRRFGRPPSVVVTAPGRVNLIGDHTDYNDGFCLPMAIDRYTVVAGDMTAREPRCVTVHSVAMGETIVIDPARPDEDRSGWGRYVAGVLDVAAGAGVNCEHGMDVWIESSVPPGAGLSSSAALEVALMMLLETTSGSMLDVEQRARLCRRVEHEHAGVRCGPMDQYAVCAAQLGHAILLDCRSLEATHVSIDSASVAVLVADTGTNRELASSVYGKRRAECERAAMLAGVSSLRHLAPDDLPRWRDRMPDTLFRRMRHVVLESQRTIDAAAALRCRDWESAGRLMEASHDSLRDDFEVGSDELDTMVALTRELDDVSRPHGCRMTGGGMGGCTVMLVRPDAAGHVAGHLIDGYRRRVGLEPRMYLTDAVAGATVVQR